MKIPKNNKLYQKMQMLYIYLLIFLTNFWHKNLSYPREGTTIDSSPHMFFFNSVSTLIYSSIIYLTRSFISS